MPVDIRGKTYITVEERLSQFRQAYPDWSIVTQLISADDTRVVVQATIANPEGRVISTGLAEETRAASAINRVSAVENCETSAVGRALAFHVFGGGGIGSADEIVKAAINEFAQADTLEELRQSYTNWFKAFGGTEAEAQINAAKERRKKQLEKTS